MKDSGKEKDNNTFAWKLFKTDKSEFGFTPFPPRSSAPSPQGEGR